jgi:hypothetical protein
VTVKTMPDVSPEILRAAKLFASRLHDHLSAPFAFRRRSENIVWASDGHTMFVARDPAGRGYTTKPVMLADCDATMPKWWPCVTPIRDKRQAVEPVSINPKYHARVMRAAVILDIKCIGISVAGPADPIAYTLGPDAWACVMPMREADRPVVPAWLRKISR